MSNKNYYDKVTLAAMANRSQSLRERAGTASAGVNAARERAVGERVPWGTRPGYPPEYDTCTSLYVHQDYLHQEHLRGQYSPDATAAHFADLEARVRAYEAASADYSGECERVNGERLAAAAGALAELGGKDAVIARLEAVVLTLKGGENR